MAQVSVAVVAEMWRRNWDLIERRVLGDLEGLDVADGASERKAELRVLLREVFLSGRAKIDLCADAVEELARRDAVDTTAKRS